MRMQPLNDYLLLFATGLFYTHTQHQPLYFGTRMKSKVTRHKSEFKYMQPFPGSSGSPLSPSSRVWEEQKEEEAHPSPTTETAPRHRASPGQLQESFTEPLQHLPSPSIGLQDPDGSGSPVRVGNSAKHLKLPGLLCAQSCLWCLELFAKWLRNTEPAVWLTKWSNAPGELEENPEHFSEQTASTALLIIMTHQTRCLNTQGKWEQASAPSCIIFLILFSFSTHHIRALLLCTWYRGSLCLL